MDALKQIWEDTYLINWYEAAPTHKASIITICNFLQESAWRHANHLGFGYRDAERIHQVWVLIRLFVKMEYFPSWGEQVTIRTWPRGAEGLVAMRDFLIQDRTGKRLGAASSHWMILDTVTRKPQPAMIVRDILPLVTNDPVLEDVPDKIRITSPLPFRYSLVTQYSHLDMYQHVNTSRYIEWTLNMFPPGTHRDRELESILVEFLSETHLGDEVHLFSDVSANPTLVRGVRQEDDKTLFRARLTWK
jgi:medium-chain acyl-[acyl-carrier-protein] hydrolase